MVLECACSSAVLLLQGSEGQVVELHAGAILVKAERRERGSSHAEVLPLVVDDPQALGRKGTPTPLSLVYRQQFLAHRHQLARDGAELRPVAHQEADAFQRIPRHPPRIVTRRASQREARPPQPAAAVDGGAVGRGSRDGHVRAACRARRSPGLVRCDHNVDHEEVALCHGERDLRVALASWAFWAFAGSSQKFLRRK